MAALMKVLCRKQTAFLIAAARARLRLRQMNWSRLRLLAALAFVQLSRRSDTALLSWFRVPPARGDGSYESSCRKQTAFLIAAAHGRFRTKRLHVAWSGTGYAHSFFLVPKGLSNHGSLADFALDMPQTLFAFFYVDRMGSF